MYILGISCHFHDAAAALLVDGELCAAAAEERFTRKKHDSSYPHHAIHFCLEQAGIAPEQLDYVVFYEKPLLKFERLLLSILATFPQSARLFRESMLAWFNEKLWIKGKLITELNLRTDKLLFVEHHLGHAASAFFCSPFEEAAILTIDGVGEWTTTAIGRASALWNESEQPLANAISLEKEIRFPHSIGLLYSTFTAFLGFRVNNGEYKVMGMAPYGEPKYLSKIEELIRVEEDGSFRLNMEFFCFHKSIDRSFTHKFVELFGPPRCPDSDFFTLSTHPNREHSRWNEEIATQNQIYADIAASIQHFTEELILGMVRHLHDKTGMPNLCMAGGVALNSVANGRILRETPMENLFIQPAAGDDGGALGAALYAYHILLKGPRQFVMEHVYWGPGFSSVEAESAIRAAEVDFEYVQDADIRAAMIVDDLITGKVVALFQGRSEWGPRALGNRSILADPRREEMKEIVNTSIKFREPFRPFAPVVLEERASEFFDDMDNEGKCYPLRFMQSTFSVKEGKRKDIPAVTHSGGSGRLQTMRREWNQLYYRVIELFGEKTGIPVLLNTSFNLRGEPIVNTPADALKTFNESGLDTLYLGEHVIRKED